MYGLTKEYVERVTNDYISEGGNVNDTEAFTMWLINNGHISETYVRDDSIRNEHDANNPTKSVGTLAKKYGLTERSIWNILKK